MKIHQRLNIFIHKSLPIYIFLLTFVSPSLLHATKSVPRDMVLIYAGSPRRPHWNAEMFAPYVSMQNGTKKQWLFDGFLFLEFKNDEGRCFASYYEKQGARKIEWKKLIDDYFTPRQIVCALNDQVGEVRKNIPGKFSRRKIVLCLPEPIPNQKDWGKIDDKTLDFTSQTDRLAACKWYVDYAIKKFKQAKLNNLELSGFYWIAEEATNSRGISIMLGNYIRSKKLKFNWIPYFCSDGYKEWEKLGFDIAYYQPNYFFKENVPIKRLDIACQAAKENGMCMEMEFDERALSTGKFAYRMRDYINAFDKYGIFQNLPIAYYQGTLAFYKLFYSKQKADNDLYMELAQRIATRQEIKKLPLNLNK